MIYEKTATRLVHHGIYVFFLLLASTALGDKYEEDGDGSDTTATVSPPTIVLNVLNGTLLQLKANCSDCLRGVKINIWADAEGRKLTSRSDNVVLKKDTNDTATIALGSDLWKRHFALDLTTTIKAVDGTLHDVRRVIYLQAAEKGMLSQITWADYICATGLAKCSGPTNARKVILKETVR